jgi:hypothetical protein
MLDFYPGESIRGLKLPTYLHLVVRLRMVCAISLLSICLRGLVKEKEKGVGQFHASKVINGALLHPVLILFLLHLLLLLLLLLLFFPMFLLTSLFVQ